MPDLKYGKRDVTRMAAVLDADHNTVEDAAQAVLAEAERMYQEKSKWIVLGQLSFITGKGKPDYEDRIAVAAYGTETQARNAASALSYSSQTHEQFRTWVLPIHHGTPAEFYRARKQARDAEKMADASWSERELDRRVKWVAANPNTELPDDMRGAVPFVDPDKTYER